MVAYTDFVALCASPNSEERGQAAHMAAAAYLSHTGPADEHAALYAALVGFLDDPSARVRGALAYGLLHAREAPRPILLALLQDTEVIARAVVQYSPALIEADLLGVLASANRSMQMALAQRETLTARLVEGLVARGERDVLLHLLRRTDAPFSAEMLRRLARETEPKDARRRGALLGRPDLPADARLALVEAATAALSAARLVKGAIAPQRLTRLLRDAADGALAGIGEEESRRSGTAYAAALIGSRRISTRILLHAVVNGQVLFFADCLAELSGMPRGKVFSLLERGSRIALNALLGRCGLSKPIANLLARLVCHARDASVADDVTARHYVVTAITEELIVEHEGSIPAELEEAFGYLSEQNVALARRASQGVLTAFAEGGDARPLPLPAPRRLALPAA